MLLIQLDENNTMVNVATAERNERPDVFITAPEGTTVDDLGKRWTGSAWEDVPVPEPEPVGPSQEELLRQEVTELKAQLAAVKETTDATAMAVVEIGMAVMMP